MKNILLLFAFMSLFTALQAQESADVAIRDQSILFEPSTNSIIIGGDDRVNLGMFRRHFAKYVYGELAIEEAGLAHEKMRNGTYMVWVSSTLVVGSTALIPVSWPLSLIGLVGNSFLMYRGLQLMNKGDDHLQRALWLHNRDAMNGRIPNSDAQGAFR